MSKDLFEALVKKEVIRLHRLVFPSVTDPPSTKALKDLQQEHYAVATKLERVEEKLLYAQDQLAEAQKLLSIYKKKDYIYRNHISDAITFLKDNPLRWASSKVIKLALAELTRIPFEKDNDLPPFSKGLGNIELTEKEEVGCWKNDAQLQLLIKEAVEKRGWRDTDSALICKTCGEEVNVEEASYEVDGKESTVTCVSHDSRSPYEDIGCFFDGTLEEWLDQNCQVNGPTIPKTEPNPSHTNGPPNDFGPPPSMKNTLLEERLFTQNEVMEAAEKASHRSMETIQITFKMTSSHIYTIRKNFSVEMERALAETFPLAIKVEKKKAKRIGENDD